MSSVRTRIAPSPTGLFHIGTARTALFNYLFAKCNGGVFIVRIEDTDRERSKPEFEKDILGGLYWLGLTWDEGPMRDGAEKGNYGPYHQKERVKQQKTYLEKLLAEGKAGYCDVRENYQKDGERGYDVHFCERHGGFNKEGKGIIRFKIPTNPSNHQTTFIDGVRGQGHVFTRLLGNFSIAKSLDEPLYNFAAVVDDHDMEITHVIRGEDHFSNTPKQVLVAEALGWTSKNERGDIIPPWQYFHLPLILGADRSKLSKRDGATSLTEYREQGYLPEAMVNFMAFLGWNPGNDREIFSLKDLEKEFSLEKVQKGGAVFNREKLDWMNGCYIRQKSSDELFPMITEYFKKAGLPADNTEMIKKIIALEQSRLKKLSDIVENARFFFKMPIYDTELLRWKDMTDDRIRESLNFSSEILKNNSVEKSEIIFQEMIEKNEWKKGEVLWPLRVALSGKKASPGPFEILGVLGVEESLKRVQRALALFT